MRPSIHLPSGILLIVALDHRLKTPGLRLIDLWRVEDWMRSHRAADLTAVSKELGPLLTDIDCRRVHNILRQIREKAPA